MDGFVETTFGRIHYLMQGEGAPLVLSHSNGASAHEFDHCFERLAKSFRVIAWDMPGHGDSAPLGAHMTIGAYADALEAFLSALGIGGAVVGGSSVGATIAADFAARRSERVSKVVLIELAARTEDWWARCWPMVEWMFSIPQQSAEMIGKRLARAPDESLVQRWNIDRHKAGARAMMDVMWAGREYDLDSNLGKIDAPALLLFGDRSPVIENARACKEKMRDATLEILAGAGHFPMIDEPEAFCEAIVKFALRPTNERRQS